MKNILIEKKMRYKGIVIPPGWSITVPEVQADPQTLAKFSGYFQRLGASPAQANARARDIIQQSSDGHYTKHIKMFVGAYALKYKARFGDLDGYEPGLIQQYFVPFDKLGGRGGHIWVNQLFAKMRGDR